MGFLNFATIALAKIALVTQLSPAQPPQYRHPQLLRVAEAFNGPDFVPFRENIFYNAPGVGPATGWHIDGRTIYFTFARLRPCAK